MQLMHIVILGRNGYPTLKCKRILAVKSDLMFLPEVRRIRQQYVEVEDHWQVSGSSWHWRPVTRDIDYELKGE